MKTTVKRIMALFVALIIASSSVFLCTAAALEEKGEAGIIEKGSRIFSVLSKTFGIGSKDEKNVVASEANGEEPYIKLTSDSLTVTEGKTLQLKATAYNFENEPELLWSSSDNSVATVDQNGLVRGGSAGKTTIIASCTFDGKYYSDSFVVNVVTRSNPVKDLLEGQQILSYQYSYVDDYYYTNNEEAWQKNFGFGKAYDLAAPWVAMEYDYVRVFFEYQGKDWMIQLWKGQYGYIFYGSEIGVYNKPHSDDPDGVFTFYQSASREDWLPMTMTLYRDVWGNGNYVRQFTREYDEYWWCTGFKDGHLRRVEPANELRLTGTITLKDEEMTSLFTQGLIDCGLEKYTREQDIDIDGFCVDGNNVTFVWQDISEAENTMPIKVGVGALALINFASFFVMIIGFMMIAMIGFFWIFIL